MVDVDGRTPSTFETFDYAPDSSQWTVTTRNNCVICGDEKLEEICKSPDSPVYLGCTDSQVEDAQFLDMVSDTCENCDGLQVRNYLSIEVVWGEAHADAVGGVWRRHHRLFATFL